MGAADVSIRLSLTDADLVLQTLRNIGAQGQNAMAVVEAASDKATVSGQRLERQVASLKNALDPTTKAMADQARSQETLNAALARGSLTTAEHTKFTELLAARYKEVVPALNASAAAHGAHGASSSHPVEHYLGPHAVDGRLAADVSQRERFRRHRPEICRVTVAQGERHAPASGDIPPCVQSVPLRLGQYRPHQPRPPPAIAFAAERPTAQSFSIHGDDDWVERPERVRVGNLHRHRPVEAGQSGDTGDAVEDKHSSFPKRKGALRPQVRGPVVHSSGGQPR